MSTALTIILGFLAAGLQVYAYILYIRDDKIDPNPTTWFMFAYGTTMTVFLSLDIGATWSDLFLPITCSFLCIYVSFRCWKKSRGKKSTGFWPAGWWPEDLGEQVAFVLDIVVTVGYALALILKQMSIMSPEQKYLAVAVILFLSNVSTFFQFYPILHDTYLHPEKENAKPWMVWAGAYGTLALVTYLNHGEIWHHLMFYPLSSCFLHLLMGWFARSSRQKAATPVHA